MDKRNRPKNLNLFTIRLPINAVVSILHRASGMALFVVLPVLLWALNASVQSERSYIELSLTMQHWLVKLFLIALSWAFFHHFYAGLRHLAMDVHWMTSLQKARFSSRLVFVFVVFTVAIFAVWVW
ncbi:MAG: succinate dehydrogenase, cytochrome b556 subunit [Methylotenera sp. 24-45-7]|jgi:succinate dehydrogenase / fumarate reductase cytochrome b subunit|nr:MAG: succinate dehydrogenase, cytochrome b556 subunit [Mehylophilales bacterium 35-46-6]OYZ41665.1 MAG: succinate dehydrogenase, cytochrome b556 subunit [Methylotenera sp. 24-45-7]OZA09488.1 MAG: succinate dehydrogenase, cytochrome b556 subunit [Methylotenera sp. 17-45-7]OZA53216.1 MAG: succinate dehydrogenase, cytochrome b556 subunit [Methylophilales bacterium 39-45-7]HQS37819.1 succinate dehydrogenase, cytochrome b556 subunit [Methylotenera sp.]